MDNNLDDKKVEEKLESGDSAAAAQAPVPEDRVVNEEPGTPEAEAVASCTKQAEPEAVQPPYTSQTGQAYTNPSDQADTGETGYHPQSQYTNPSGGSQQYTNPSGGSQQYTNPSGGSQQYTNPSGGSQQYTNPSGGSQQYTNPSGGSQQYTNPAGGSTQQRPYQSYQQQNYNQTYQQSNYGNANDNRQQGGQGQGFQQDNYNYNVGNGTGYNYNYRDDEAEKSIMSMGDWFLTILPMIFPCFGIPLYFYWAFGANVNPNRKNYCRVNLIILGVVLVIYIIFFAVFMAAAGSSLGRY